VVNLWTYHASSPSGYRGIELVEVGLRMTMRCFEMKGGTLEKGAGEKVAWALTRFTRIGRKKDYLLG